MGVPISNVTRRVVYAASGTGPYNFTFEILAATDVAVYRDDTLLTLTTNYTVTINANGTGFITLTAAPTGATQIAIVGNRSIQRMTDFVTGGDFFANTVNDEMDQQTIFAQQNAEGLQRALSAPQTDPTNINMVLPRAADRAGKTLNFDSNGNPIAGLAVVASATANVATWLGTPTSANLRAAMTDETGSGALVFGTSPTLSGPVISDGTANGVPYLNGSKVLTSGSALTFDGTNLGIGTSSPDAKLHVAGTIYAAGRGTSFALRTPDWRIYNNVSNGLAFNNFTSDVVTIDSSGNLLVGNTSRSNRLSVDASTGTTAVARFGNNTSSGNVSGIETSLESNGNSTSSYHFRGVTQGVNIWYLYGNGTSSFTSDQRLKKNIATARDGYLDDLMQLRVVKYHWKSNEDSSPKELGLIAQEVEQVFPGLVQEADVEFDGVTPKVLKGSVLPFMLLKAIQEQQAIITAQQSALTALTARVAALEAA